VTTARAVAVDVLHQSRSRQGFAAELTENLVSSANLSPVDRRFVTQLVFGVIRRRGTLDALLKPYLKLPSHAIEPRVWDVLHLGAFQIAFLTHVPPHAAVHETVSLADHVGSPKARGFINGVLRRVTELVTDHFVNREGPDALPFDSERLPGPDGPRLVGRYRKLNQPVLPTPAADLPEYLSAGFSWPRWLANHWLDRHGPEECFRLGFWFNAPPPLWIRTNKLNVDRETYRLRLAASLIECEPGGHAQSLKLVHAPAIRDLPGYEEGDFAVQDHSSMLPAAALAPQPGMRVLDLCAAPGGKTTHLAELMDNRGTIVACDIDAKRLETVTSLCHRLKIKGVETVVLEEHGEPPPGPFHAAIVDVPCSNTGVLGRRPEVRWRLKPTEFEHLIRLQTRLLFQAIERVKPGGAIVYSTCSIEPDENEGVVKAARQAFRDLKLEAEHTSIPGLPSDGGYWARLRKPSGVS